MVPIWNFHKQTPGTLPTECFLYISKAKIGLTRNFTANSSHKPFPVCSLWDVSLTHPGVKTCLREATPTNPYPVCSLLDVSLTHPGWNDACRISSNKPVPSMFSMGCFSYTSTLKWCLREHLPQTSAQYATYRLFHLHIQAKMVPMANISLQTHTQHVPCRMSLLHIQAKMVPTGTPPTNQCPVCYIQDVSLTHPG